MSVELDELRFEVPLDTVPGLFFREATDNLVLVLGITRLNRKRIVRPKLKEECSRLEFSSR